LLSTDASFRESPVHVQLMQGIPSSACLDALTQPCNTNIGQVMEAMTAPSASAAIGGITEFCMNCVNPDTEIANIVTTCNFTDAENLAFTRLAALVDAACDDENCAGNVLWSFSNIDSRRDTFCPNVECGTPILEAVLGDLLAHAAEDNDCAANFFELNCKTDETDATVYCTDFIEDSNGGELDINASEFCATSCPGYLSVILENLADDQCFDVDDIDGFECDNDFRLADYCTTNGEDLCFDVIDAPEVTECEVFGMVPAPGMGLRAPANCSEACQGQLQAFVTDVGCCAGSFLDLSCADPVLRTFIRETCGVAYDTCSRPALLSQATGEPTAEASMVDTSVVLAGILAGAALAILS